MPMATVKIVINSFVKVAHDAHKKFGANVHHQLTSLDEVATFDSQLILGKSHYQPSNIYNSIHCSPVITNGPNQINVQVNNVQLGSTSLVILTLLNVLLQYVPYEDLIHLVELL